MERLDIEYGPDGIRGVTASPTIFSKAIVGSGVDGAAEVIRRLAAAGVDMGDVGPTLENQGVAGFHASHQHVLAALAVKTGHLGHR